MTIYFVYHHTPDTMILYYGADTSADEEATFALSVRNRNSYPQV